MARLPKIIVGIISRGMLPSFYVQSISGALIGKDELFDVTTAYCNWEITDRARNTVVQDALEKDFDYVFFMDTDMIFDRGTLAMMVRHMANIPGELPPILGGVYCHRGGDHRWHVYKWVEEIDGWKSTRFPLNQGVIKVDAIGTGCMLIDVNVFKILEWPWFEYEYTIFQGKRERLSEDMVFCKKAMKAGIPIYADTDIKCGHMFSVQVWPTDDGGYEVKTLAGDVY